MTSQLFRPLTAATTPRVEADGRLDFVVTGDGRPTLPFMPYPRHAIAIMNEIALLSPTCVLYTGDAFWGYKASRQEMLNDIDRFRALAATTGVPLYNVPGNHETQSDVGAVAILKEKGHDLWGSFDIGQYHFVALNTDEVNREGRVTGEQLDWLG